MFPKKGIIWIYCFNNQKYWYSFIADKIQTTRNFRFQKEQTNRHHSVDNPLISEEDRNSIYGLNNLEVCIFLSSVTNGNEVFGIYVR